MISNAALTSPSAARNREPILAVLRRVLPARGTVLEIASGTGEHAVHCAAALPGLTWQPTDRDAEALASIAAHRADAGLPNLLAPLALDVTAPSWPVEHADAIVSINMIHIAPWHAAEGLMDGIARLTAIVPRSPEEQNIRQVALLIARCALAREESRGAQFRTDYPEKSEAFARHSIISRDGDVTFQ